MVSFSSPHNGSHISGSCKCRVPPAATGAVRLERSLSHLRQTRALLYLSQACANHVGASIREIKSQGKYFSSRKNDNWNTWSLPDKDIPQDRGPLVWRHKWLCQPGFLKHCFGGLVVSVGHPPEIHRAFPIDVRSRASFAWDDQGNGLKPL